MRKILVNAYLALNLGDDLFLKILFDRYPEVNWVLPTTDSEYKRMFNMYNIKIPNIIITKLKNRFRIPNTNNIINNYDAVLYVGGSIFIQNNIWKKQFYLRRKTIDSFSRLNKPSFILGSNFGPYHNEEFYKLYKELFSECSDVCLRDSYSYELFKELENVRLNPDIVFNLKPQKVLKIKDSIGLSLINLSNRSDLQRYEESYIIKIREIIKYGVTNNKKFTMFSFCEREGDVEIINKILLGLDEYIKEKVEVMNYDGNLDEFLRKFESMESIIGTRFHSCILSQVYNQSLFPIIYSKKTLNVLRDINLDNAYIEIKNIKDLDIKNVFSTLSSKKEVNKQYLMRAEKQFEKLDEFLKGSIHSD